VEQPGDRRIEPVDSGALWESLPILSAFRASEQMDTTRKVTVWTFAVLGVVTLVFIVALVGIIIQEWPRTPEAPGGRVESPPWGSLDAAIEETHRRGKVMPPFIADATHGPAADGKLFVLVMSAGGQYGAFGAGVLDGWTRSGHRPYLDVVTGISVGSILAPIAFLGSEYDEQLKRLVQNIAAAVGRYPIKNIGPVELLGAIWGRGFPVSAKIESTLRTFYIASSPIPKPETSARLRV
jgi:predicted acylesterase/phospholipase RssA